MKSRNGIIGAIALLFLATTALGCSSGSSDDDDSQKLESGKVTLENLAGTWSNTSTGRIFFSGTKVGSSTITTYITFDGTGHFSRIKQHVDDYDAGSIFSDDSYTDASKGSVSVSADGTLTETAEFNAYEATLVTSIPDADWETDTTGKKESYTAALIGGKYYPYAYFRQGTGSGIEGTWYFENSVEYSDSSSNSSYTTTLTVDGTSVTGVSKRDGTVTDTWVDSYTIKDSSTLIIVNGTTTLEEKYALASDRFVSIDEYSEYVKQ